MVFRYLEILVLKRRWYNDRYNLTLKFENNPRNKIE